MSDRNPKEVKNYARAEKLYHGITNISEDIIEEAQEQQPHRKPQSHRKRLSYGRWGIAAAVLCMALAGVALWKGSDSVDSDSPVAEVGDGFVRYRSGITVSEEGVTIPPMEVMLGKSDGIGLDMIAFFIYQGHCYEEYERLENVSSDIVGEYLGTAIGLIDEWTPEDGYVEFAGSVEGDFYSVKGFDPSFLLCMQKEGAVFLYVCNRDITLKTGADLYEERLHLSEAYCEVRYETRASWYYGSGEVRQLDEPRSQEVLDFIQALDEAEFIPVEEVAAQSGISPFSESEIYHMYFLTESGMTVHLRLHEGGYVRFQGLINICVQIPEETFRRLTTLFQS